MSDENLSHDNNKSDSSKDVGACCNGKAERFGAANHRENRGRSHLCGPSGRICNNQVLFAAIFPEYVSRQESSMQLRSLFCHLRLSFLGTILDLWGLPQLEGCWNRRLSFTFYTSWYLYKVGPKEGTFSAHPRIDPVTGQMYFFSGMFVQVHV